MTNINVLQSEIIWHWITWHAFVEERKMFQATYLDSKCVSTCKKKKNNNKKNQQHHKQTLQPNKEKKIFG